MIGWGSAMSQHVLLHWLYHAGGSALSIVNNEINSDYKQQCLNKTLTCTDETPPAKKKKLELPSSGKSKSQAKPMLDFDEVDSYDEDDDSDFDDTNGLLADVSVACYCVYVWLYVNLLYP